MFHHVAHAVAGEHLFRDWTEARALWIRLSAAAPGLVALCLMPDHLHLLHPRRVQIGPALSGHARWVNRRRGRRGRLYRPSATPDPVVGQQKIRRSIRYIHLNPCRAGLAPDPLAWPFSTHLDAVGLALSPVRRTVSDPVGFHRWVSGDPTVHVQGTDLPVPPAGLLDLERILAAVSFASRTPADWVLRHKCPQRSAFVANARSLSGAGTTTIADFAGVSRSMVTRTPPATSRAVAALAADTRIDGLGSLDLALRFARRRR